MKKCIECGQEKPLKKFFSNGCRNGKRRYKPRCGSCEIKVKSARIRSLVKEFYGGLRCSRCGYDKSPYALQCHHRNPSEKESEISKMGSLSKEKILKELKKCDLVCANCHIEIHWGMG